MRKVMSLMTLAMALALTLLLLLAVVARHGGWRARDAEVARLRAEIVCLKMVIEAGIHRKRTGEYPENFRVLAGIPPDFPYGFSLDPETGTASADARVKWPRGDVIEVTGAGTAFFNSRMTGAPWIAVLDP